MNDINEIIGQLEHVKKELKIDLDEILDIINEIKKWKDDKMVGEAIVKDANKTLKLYKTLLKNHSALLKNNEESLRRAIDLKMKMLQ